MIIEDKRRVKRDYMCRYNQTSKGKSYNQEHSKAWYEKHKNDPGFKEHRAEILKKYKKTHPEQQKIWWLKKKYGLTLAEYNQIHERQQGACAICLKSLLPGLTHVDHDHNTGRVRGLLCRRCNRAIGLLYDDLLILRHAIEYLESR